MNWNELRDKAYQSAMEHGFYDKKTYSDEHYIMQIICEVAEMVEADRKGEFANVEAFKNSDTDNDEDFKDEFNLFIKDSLEDEMADIAINVLSYSGLKGYEIDLYIHNILDYFMQLGGFMKLNCSICEFALRITKKLAEIESDTKHVDNKLASIIAALYTVAQENNIDLLWHIEQKMKYNETRPRLNGKAY